MQIKLKSSGLVVTADNSRSRAPGFVSRRCILNECHDFEHKITRVTLNRLAKTYNLVIKQINKKKEILLATQMQLKQKKR